MALATMNPATGETEKEFEPHSDEELEQKIAAASRAFGLLRDMSFDDRARRAVSAAELLEAELPELARTMTTEMGKTFAEAKGEVAKCATALRWFAAHAESYLAEETVEVNGGTGRILYRPMGPVLAVMPWNFPMWQVMRFAAPALMAGNVGLLKHSSNVPQTALAIEDLFLRAGFPAGAFQTLLITPDRVGKVIEDERVRAVTLTGSEGAGRSVAAKAGGELKKSVMELGGSDPFIVMPSCDLQKAIEVGVRARVQNNGQSCIAAKRFVVHRDVYEEFERTFVDAMASLTVGDPMQPATEVGPLALPQAPGDVHEQVEDARKRGASVPCGGYLPEGKGFYYPPTVITGITPDMRVDQEEVFAPVAMLYRVEGLEEAIRLANATGFGLGASVWTSEEDERDRLVEEIDAGMVFVNAMVASMPELPFGGTKSSGYGRELSALGIKEFCEAKTVFEAPNRPG